MTSIANAVCAAGRLQALGRYQQALEISLAALDQGARSTRLLALISDACKRLGRHSDALAAAFAACLVEEPTAGRLCDVGLLADDMGLPVEAAAAYEEALARDPLHARSRRLQAALHARLRRGADIAVLSRCYALQASRLLERGSPVAALKLADQLEALAPGSGAADLIRGAVLEKMGRYAEAARSYAAAERFDRERAHTARLRVRAKDARVRRAQARPMVEEIRRRLRAGDDVGAARVATRLVGLVPDAPGPYVVWSRLAARKGYIQNAIQHLRLAVHRADESRLAILGLIRDLSASPGATPAFAEKAAS